ncbi:uncharacterized protein N0V96_011803 [Colletotrichum fioriniae]|uniref:uncharacterized protein n=1 Tax=Colletotrichum fioriniae TaxID=710243 RepID=UPI00230031AE|nr:uncharacterized protein COL516b_005690 [Colletotrichum fioriniae]KAJ0304909.1 hypothetical protein COL516b_005690 [Colletotrichum fioriniae]KAJ3938119.1 hypothetical protein N0V96_011803 [Colletotrichum fioriniae]
MCVSDQFICECNWPRDTVRYCVKYIQTGKECPGLSKNLLLDTERRKTESGVYRCSNPTCEIWDLGMCHGIRERGKYVDQQFSLNLGRWNKEEKQAEKPRLALVNEANPVESGGEDHASIMAISDDSDYDDDDDDDDDNDDNDDEAEGLEVLQQIGPVPTGDVESQPVRAVPEEVQRVDESMLANIPKPEVDVPTLDVDEFTIDDLESLFGGPSCPPTPDMRLVQNHRSICLPTASHLPSPDLSQPTPENPVKEGDSHTPPANTKSEQSTPVILPAQAPLQQQAAPQVSRNPAPTYPAQNTMAMGSLVGEKTPNSYPAVPQQMRPTLSGPDQATLRALRAQTPRRDATPTASPAPVHAAAVRAASQGPRPAMNTSRSGGHRRPNVRQRRPIIPARGIPIQNGYSASPQASQGSALAYPSQNTMTTGNNMPINYQQPSVPQAHAHAHAAPTQNAYMAAQFGSRMPGTVPDIQNTAGMGMSADMGMGMGNNVSNGAGQGISLAMSTQATLSQGMPPSQPTTSWPGTPSQNTAYRGASPQIARLYGMAPQSMAPQGTASPDMLLRNPALQNMPPQNMPSSGMARPMWSLGNPYQNTPAQFGNAASSGFPQQASGGFTNFVQSPQTPYQGLPSHGLLPQGMSPQAMPTQSFPPQNGYPPRPFIRQSRTPRISGLASNSMLAQQRYMNPAYRANTAAPQYQGLSSPMAGTAPTQASAGVAAFPRASNGNSFPQQTLPQIPPQPSFDSDIWEQAQAQIASMPQTASGMPGMPLTQGSVAGPASGQKRSHDTISNGYTDPLLLTHPSLTPGGIPSPSPANTPSSMDGERQPKRRAM